MAGQSVCRFAGPSHPARGWEIRSSLPGRRIARILFCNHEGSLLLLHGLIKKTQKTPDSDLHLATTRMKQLKAAARKKKGRKR